MEFVVRKNDLLKELSLLQGIVERKNTIPILANVLIEATGNEITLAGPREPPREPPGLESGGGVLAHRRRVGRVEHHDHVASWVTG